MSDEIRSDLNEFLSYLSTCMSFYKMHLTTSEQEQSIQDIALILKNTLYAEEKDSLVRALYPGYDVTISKRL